MEEFSNNKGFFKKNFIALYGLGLLGILAGLPYIFALIGNFVEKSSEPLPFPLPVLFLLQFFQLAVYLAIAVAGGLYASRKIGCGVPVIENWIQGKLVADHFQSVLKLSIPVGIAVGALLLLLLVFVFMPLEPDLRKVLVSDIPVWKKFLASFYGGIVEEILMRLFLVSLLAWFFGKLQRSLKPNAITFWSASVIIAIIFGLGHLGAASLMLNVTPTVIIAALILNGIAALTFSYLYRKQGLESAMIAHFSADIVIHVVGSTVLPG